MQTREETNYPLIALLPFLKPYKSRVITALIVLVLASSSLLALPVSIGNVVDMGFTKGQPVSQNQLLLFTLVSLLFAVLTTWRFYLVSTLGEHVVADIRKKLFSQVLRLDSHQFETIKVGEILSRLTTDTTLIEQIVGTSISLALRNMIQLIGGIIMLFITSWRLTCVVLVITPMVLVPMMGILRLSRRLARISQDKLAETNAYAGEVLYAVQVAQSFTHEPHHNRKYADAIETSFITAKQRIRIKSLFSFVMSFSILIAIMAVFWAGSKLVVATPPIITQGELVQFLTYTIFVATAMAAISEVWSDIQRASGASERILELLLAKPGIESPKNPIVLEKKVQGGVVFENVHFSYPSRMDKKVIDGLDISIPAGKMYALVGPSGAGKSTILQLILRFYQQQQGKITIDGHEISQLALQDLRNMIALVPQEVIIFSGTIYDNILYGQPEASKEQVIQAAKMALVDDFVKPLKDGYDTTVGERGLRLSGGQRQRLAIARAFLRNSPILLLDEATSALDAESERLVQKALQTLIANRTTLVIAHRLATIQQADRILFIEDGKIQSQGRHEELLEKSSAYRHLAKLQFVD